MRILKIHVNGGVPGPFGKAGRRPGWFDFLHAVACPDEGTPYAAQEFSYRFDTILADRA